MYRVGITQAVLIVGLMSTATGCKSLLEERCDEICDCERCTEADLEECEVYTEAGFDVADTYGCADEADAYMECELESYRCVDDNYTLPGPACPEERDALGSCVFEASGREPGAYYPPSFF